MLAIDIEGVDTGGSAGCDADQRSGILPPQVAQTSQIAFCVFEAMRSRRALIFQAGKTEPPVSAQRQRGLERRERIAAGHEPAPVLFCVSGA